MRTLRGHHLPGNQIDDGLGDVGGVISDPLDVLGAEQKVRAERDIAWILHHVREEVAEHGILKRVEVDVELPDLPRPFRITLGVCVEHVLQEFGRVLVHMPEADDRAGNSQFRANLDRALRDVLGEVADPFEVSGHANGANQLAEVDRHRLAASDSHYREIFDFALQRVEAGIDGDDLTRKHPVGAGERIHGFDHHLLGDPAHFDD